MSRMELLNAIWELKKLRRKIEKTISELSDALSNHDSEIDDSVEPLQTIMDKMLRPEQDGSFGTLKTYYEEAITHEEELFDTTVTYMSDKRQEFADILILLQEKMVEVDLQIESLQAQLDSLPWYDVF